MPYLPALSLAFSIIKTPPPKKSMYLVRTAFWFPSTPERYLLKLSSNEIAAEDLSRLRLFEVTELDRSQSVSQQSLHVNISQYAIKNLTILQPPPIESCLFFFQLEDTAHIKWTNLLIGLAVTLNWSLLTSKLLHLNLLKLRSPLLQKLHLSSRFQE